MRCSWKASMRLAVRGATQLPPSRERRAQHAAEALCIARVEQRDPKNSRAPSVQVSKEMWSVKSVVRGMWRKICALF